MIRASSPVWLAAFLFAALIPACAQAALAPNLGALTSVAHEGREIVLVQDQGEERPSIFRFLFGGGRDPEPPPVRVQPSPMPEQQVRPRKPRQPRVQRQQPPPEIAKPRPVRPPAQPQRQVVVPRRAAPSPPPPPPPPREPPPVQKAADAKRVLVIGDFMAGALVKGLTEDYSQDPSIQVIDGTNGSSGLVRTDVHNWPAEVPSLVESSKPDAIVVMVGSNDRQPITTPTASLPPGSDGWKAAYSDLVSSFADALKKTGKPALWVGLAPVRSGLMSRDYSTINGILHEQLEGKGLKFIDAWNGFTDENGKFVSTGPDVAGQSVQLRTSDGVNFTHSGQRKLAYFAEQDLNDTLKGGAPQTADAGPGAAGEGLEPAEQAPRIGEMLPLEAVEAGGGAALSTTASAASPGSGAATDVVAKRLAGDPGAIAPSGRADDFTWPAGSRAPAAASVQAQTAGPH